MRSQAYRVGPNEPYSKFQGHMDALPEDEREAIQRFLDGPGSTAYDNRYIRLLAGPKLELIQRYI